MVRSAHLKDDRLFECYVAARSGEPLDPRAADHLSQCSDCSVRYTALLQMLDGLRDEADAEIDELYAPERLRDQQQQILNRIEHLHRPARVITFPGREVNAGGHGAVRVTPRWLAAAAAAGLFIGVAVGGFLAPDRFRHTSLQSMQVGTGAPGSGRSPAPAVRVSGVVADSPDDDDFLMELELALARPHTRELVALDSMTPHVRDSGELAAVPRDVGLDIK